MPSLPTPPPPSCSAPPLIGLHFPGGPAAAARATEVAAALAGASHRWQALGPPGSGLRPWLDCAFDLLIVNPFPGWAEPAELVALARAIAGRRPLLVLTDDASHHQRLVALDNGADDAIGHHPDPRELLARVASLLRRARLAAGQLALGELAMDLIDRRVARAGRPIRMPLREFDLLAHLARAEGKVVSRSDLLRAVWDIDYDPGTNRVDVHMFRLRGRIDGGFCWPMLHTVRGHGYVLRAHAAGRAASPA